MPKPAPVYPDDVVEDASLTDDSCVLGLREDDDAVRDNGGGVGKADSSPTNCSRVDRVGKGASGGSMHYNNYDIFMNCTINDYLPSCIYKDASSPLAEEVSFPSRSLPRLRMAFRLASAFSLADDIADQSRKLRMKSPRASDLQGVRKVNKRKRRGGRPGGRHVTRNVQAPEFRVAEALQ